MKKDAMFYFYVVYDEEDDVNIVFFTTKKVWEENKCLTESYSLDELKVLQPIIDKFDLVDTEESVYEIPEENVQELKAELYNNKNFEDNDEFADYIEECFCEDEEDF